MLARGTRLRPLVAAGLAVAVLASGCGSSGDGADDPADPASGAASGSSSPSESQSESPEPIEGLPTSYPPADGPRIKVPGASIHALSTYRHITDYGVLQGWGDGQSSVTFLPDVNVATSLEAFERDWVQDSGGPKKQVAQEEAVAGGKYRAWHRLDTTSDPVQEIHTFGILFLDSAWLIRITFEKRGFPEPLDEEGQQEVIGRLLASFKTDLD